MIPQIAAAQAAVAALDSLLDGIPSISKASLPALYPAVAAAQAAVAAIDAAIVANDAVIAPGLSGISSGGIAPQLAAQLTAQAHGMHNAATLQTLRAYVGRVLFNLSSATG